MTRRSLLAGLPAMAAPLRLPTKVRCALLGLDGHTGEVLTPLPQLPDVEMVAFADPDPNTVARFAKNPRLAAARSYTDWRRMLDAEKIDVIGICNANSEHAPAILACLARNIHVISEKPIATELADLEQVRRAVESSSARFTAMLPMRFSPPYLALKQIVDSGELGEIVQIDAQKSYQPSPRPAWYFKRATYGGTMAWIGIHMVDLMLHISQRDMTAAFGFQNHLGFPETGDTENVTGTVFRLDNGGVALLRMDYLRPKTSGSHGDDRLRLAGLKGIAEFQPATGVTVMSDRRTGRETLAQLPPARHLFVDFLNHIYNNAPAPIPWREILRGHQIVLAARDAMEQGQIRQL